MTSDLIIHKILPREFYGAERSWRCTQTCGAFENTRRFADLWDSTVTMHPPPPPRKSSAIQFFFQRQLSSLQQHYPDHRHYIDYSKSSLLIVNCAQTSCPSASCPPSGTSYLYPEQLRHQKADKDECKHCRTIAGKYRATNPKKLSLCLYFAGYKASE